MPFIARWPNKIGAGHADKISLISAVDLLPTFCAVANVDLPESYEPDGINQLPTLLGESYPFRTKPLFWKYESRWPAQENKPDHWVSYAIVDQHWKLVANIDLSYFELYDISRDVDEATNQPRRYGDTESVWSLFEGLAWRREGRALREVCQEDVPHLREINVIKICDIQNK